MGMFQETTTSTRERGASIFQGFDTSMVKSLSPGENNPDRRHVDSDMKATK